MTLMQSESKLKRGDLAPDFNLPATDGRKYSLKSFKKAKAILVVFMCNHCPYVNSKLYELNRIAQDYKSKGLVVIGINSNEDKNYPEDSFENMKNYVSSGKVKFLYLRDETQDVAKVYGAACTPDPFLLDSSLKLIFHSRIDNPPGIVPALEHELHRAIGEFLSSGIIIVKENPSIGCSIKWK